DAYGFLRTLEHRLQMEHGLQTHSVPDEAARRTLVARRMNFTEPDALASFNRALELHTARVRAAYERVFVETHDAADAPPSAQTRAEATTRALMKNAATSNTTTNHAASSGATTNDAALSDARTNDARTNAATVNNATADDAATEEATANHAAIEAAHVAAGAGGAVEANAAFESSAALEAGGEMFVQTTTRNAPFREPRLEIASGAHADAAATLAAAQVFAPRLIFDSSHVSLHARDTEADAVKHVARLLHDAARDSLNARRALSYVARVAASLDKSNTSIELSHESLRALVRLCGASEFFGEMIASNPALIHALTTNVETVRGRDYRALLRAEIDRESSFRAELIALRRAWSQLLVETGARDVGGELAHAESNQLQTELAAASINAAYFIARREMARRYGNLAAGPRLCVLGLGRLASGGMDYGSDLDLVIIYDSQVPSPVSTLTREEAYTRLVELMVAALSSLTRAGYLYRVDLRLRPDGRNGALVRSGESFVEYLKSRTSVWEWLAYVKLRAVGGDLELGRATEAAARRAIHEAARDCDGEELRLETRRVRERLERERGVVGQSTATRSVEIKFGAGGMLDVYFAARYLQLRDDVRDEGTDRSTRTTLARLRDAGSLDAANYQTLAEGYAALRRLDHHLRIIAGRSSRLPAAADHAVLRDLARAAGYESAAALLSELEQRMKAICAAYDNITGVTG
ncbi:MAG TPA: hypothetical protein VK363_16140, partial [Pyrinomonadaceae bacterium]|nr:hypothetical protein [Pyrinomonadaceae bacterium]